MGKEVQCKAEIVAVNQLGEGVASQHCNYSPDGKEPCVLVELCDRGLRVSPQATPCSRGYPDNLPRLHPSDN